MISRSRVQIQTSLPGERAAHAAQRVRCSFVARATSARRATASLIVASLTLSACSDPTEVYADDIAFLTNMQRVCDKTFPGRVISEQEVDAEWRASELIVGPVLCDDETIRMPLAVGEDRSRTWVLSWTNEGLLFRHEHVEPDGSPSPVTQYGGLARDGGTEVQQAFPADEKTKANFTENGIARSNTNIWTLTLDPGAQTLSYALARPATDTDEARDFRAVFDLQTMSD